MDLVKELKEVVEAIKAAAADGKVTLREALVIAKELVDVLVLIVPIILTALMTTLEKQNSEKTE